MSHVYLFLIKLGIKALSIKNMISYWLVQNRYQYKITNYKHEDILLTYTLHNNAE